MKAAPSFPEQCAFRTPLPRILNHEHIVVTLPSVHPCKHEINPLLKNIYIYTILYIAYIYNIRRWQQRVFTWWRVRIETSIASLFQDRRRLLRGSFSCWAATELREAEQLILGHEAALGGSEESGCSAVSPLRPSSLPASRWAMEQDATTRDRRVSRDQVSVAPLTEPPDCSSTWFNSFSDCFRVCSATLWYCNVFHAWHANPVLLIWVHINYLTSEIIHK